MVAELAEGEDDVLGGPGGRLLGAEGQGEGSAGTAAVVVGKEAVGLGSEAARRHARERALDGLELDPGETQREELSKLERLGDLVPVRIARLQLEEEGRAGLDPGDVRLGGDPSGRAGGGEAEGAVGKADAVAGADHEGGVRSAESRPTSRPVPETRAIAPGGPGRMPETMV